MLTYQQDVKFAGLRQSKVARSLLPDRTEGCGTSRNSSVGTSLEKPGRPSRELPPAIAPHCGKMPSVVESHTALSLLDVISTPTKKRDGRGLRPSLDPRSLADQRSATRIQMPIATDTRAPQTIIGLVGIVLANWLATNNHRMKQPMAITMPPISEAT